MQIQQDDGEKDGFRKTSQALAQEAEKKRNSSFLALSANKITIKMGHLIEKNLGRKNIGEEELSSICTWGAEMIAQLQAAVSC